MDQSQRYNYLDDERTSACSHSYFCQALKRVLEKNNLPLDVISNSKKLEDGRTVLHVWTITSFDDSKLKFFYS